MRAETVPELHLTRHLAVDERGTGLRLTWRPERGFVNLSLWRGDRCVETFHLSPSAAAEVIGFLARGLADTTSVARLASVTALPRRPSVRERAAGVLTHLARRLQPTGGR